MSAENSIDAAEIESPLAPLPILPGVSNGLPPPLPSFRSVCELPLDDDVCDAPPFDVVVVGEKTSELLPA